jgi:hypothetical protein
MQRLKKEANINGWGGNMITRRALGFGGLALTFLVIPALAQCQPDEPFSLRLRADESIRGLIPPIAQHNLKIEPDHSAAARELASHAPPCRAAPVILIIAGAFALTQIVQLVNELVRQYYYGGVVIDSRKSPMTRLSLPLFRQTLYGNPTWYSSTGERQI